MTERTINVITRWVVLGPVVLWAVWEIALIWLRRQGWDVRLISQEARSIAFRGLPTLAFVLTGLAFHFFVTWRRLPWDGTAAVVLAALWWAIGVAYLAADILDPARAHWPILTQWIRYPPVAALLGAFTAWLFFGQRSLWHPGAP